jgi:hypothetical protein
MVVGLAFCPTSLPRRLFSCQQLSRPTLHILLLSVVVVPVEYHVLRLATRLTVLIVAVSTSVH